MMTLTFLIKDHKMTCVLSKTCTVTDCADLICFLDLTHKTVSVGFASFKPDLLENR